LRLFPYSAIQFAAFNRLKLVFSDEDGNLTPVNALFAGSLGGVMATISVYPLDMVKTRLTVQHSGGDAKYLGISHAFKTIAAEEGVGAFYKGLAPSVMGVIPFAGCTFMSYEVLSKVWGKPRSKLGPVEQFLNGCLAGAFAQTFSFPFDTIRKKMQAQSKVATEGMVQADVEFTSMTDCFVKTIKKNGPLGMWRGTTANLAKVAPYAGLMFLAFEASKRVFLYMNGYTISPYKDTPKPEVDQSMRPEELKQWLKNQKA
jgi:solute carrier family 25 protein 43